MQDHQIINCADVNVQKLEQILVILGSIFEIEGTDPRLVPFMKEYADDLRVANLRVRYQAEIRTAQKRLEELK